MLVPTIFAAVQTQGWIDMRGKNNLKLSHRTETCEMTGRYHRSGRKGVLSRARATRANIITHFDCRIVFSTVWLDSRCLSQPAPGPPMAYSACTCTGFPGWSGEPVTITK